MLLAPSAGKNLQAQYERWQPRAKYKMHLDPTTEDVKKLAISCRRTAKVRCCALRRAALGWAGLGWAKAAHRRCTAHAAFPALHTCFPPPACHPQGERVLFHYNGHGVPRPTANGEVWVFNKSYTQYIPLSIYDLQAGVSAVWDARRSCWGVVGCRGLQSISRCSSTTCRRVFEQCGMPGMAVNARGLVGFSARARPPLKHAS